MLRLQKYLADCGVASRRKCEEFILKGYIKVNGKITTVLGTKIDPEKDKVEYQNRTVKPAAKKIYIKLNKPKGYVSSCYHPGKRTVLELITDKIKERVYPIGRLDQDSSGLLLLTNDGEVALKLTHPRYEHEKEYLIKLAKPLTDPMLARLKSGLPLSGKKTLPPRITKINETTIKMVLKEGKNRQIRRIVEMVDNQVVDLKRIRVGPIKLDDLRPGKYQFLSAEEVKHLSDGQKLV